MLDPTLMDETNPFSNDDAIAIVRVVQKIVAHYCKALFGSTPISMEVFVTGAAEKLYEPLRQKKWGALGPRD